MNNMPPVSLVDDHEAFGERVNAVNSATTRALYKARQKIHPKAVHGSYRALKWRFMAVLLGIYYLIPWLRYPRGPGVPDQAVLVDLSQSRFFFFAIELWPEEIYLITGLLIVAALGLFLATALLGRLWCGYACPQTVWTDLFIWVEERVEGDRAARIRLDKAPMSFSKFTRRLTKHSLWILIAMATGGAWIFYFADAPTLAYEFLTFQAPAVAYSTVAVLTTTTYLLAGSMREQVCTYMCPYSRFQGAMMDGDTYTVTYRLDRGEPRGIFKKGQTFDGRGDCIDCTQCVAACPAGIDIRDGQQLECISCGLCIDACDDVMTKIGRPTGLIGYDTLNNLHRRQHGQAESHDPIRLRTILYMTLILVVGGIMSLALEARAPFKLAIQHDRDPLYVVLADKSLRNGYTLKIENRAYKDVSYRVTVADLADADLKIVGETTMDTEGVILTVPPDDLRGFRALIHVPKSVKLPESVPITFDVTEIESGKVISITSTFRSPQ
jgi:cytochrome c oxidase accessory protein FixG